MSGIAPELREAVNVQLRTFNREANAAWYAARSLPENDAKPLNLFAFLDAGQPRAGLFAETQLLWLKISILSVHADFRRQKLGTQLMNRSDRNFARLPIGVYRKMEYQGPGFYEKLGYTIVGKLANWDSHTGMRSCF